LFEEPRVAVARRHRGVDRRRRVTVGCGHLSLAPTRMFGLTALIRAQRFAMEMLFAGDQTDTLPFLVITPVAHEPIRFPLQNLAHGGLRDRQLAGDLALRSAGGAQFPDALCTRRDHRLRLMAAGAPTMRSTRGAHASTASSIRVAVCPVYASHRVIAICTYRGSSSTRRHRRPVFCAAMIAVPLPMNGS